MRITGVRTFLVNAKMRNWLFVRIETDTPGLYGLGEATLEFQSAAVAACIEELSPLITGADPRNITRIWEHLYRYPFFKGGAVTMSAISGIDQALHDIAAKDLGIPLWQFLGGLSRDRVRMYDHVGAGSSDAVYGEMDEGLAQRIAESRADGFDAIKILAVPRSRAVDGIGVLESAERVMSIAREAAGPAMDIMVDFHGRTTAAMGLRLAKVLEPFTPLFIEEVVGPELPATEMAKVARATSIPVAAGERLYHREQFLPLLQAGAIAVAQPDLCHAGGITETTRIAALCGTFGVTLAPHNPLGPIATMVNIHVGLALPNFLIQEVMRGDVPWRHDVVTGSAAIVDGHVLPPTAPGIGVDIDERAAAEHPYVPSMPVRWVHEDGGTAEW
jgi:galactonate dehydratase